MTWLPAVQLRAQTADFRDPRWLSITGEARIHHGRPRLTRAEEDQRGAAWRKERIRQRTEGGRTRFTVSGGSRKSGEGFFDFEAVIPE